MGMTGAERQARVRARHRGEVEPLSDPFLGIVPGTVVIHVVEGSGPSLCGKLPPFSPVVSREQLRPCLACAGPAAMRLGMAELVLDVVEERSLAK